MLIAETSTSTARHLRRVEAFEPSVRPQMQRSSQLRSHLSRTSPERCPQREPTSQSTDTSAIRGRLVERVRCFQFQSRVAAVDPSPPPARLAKPFFGPRITDRNLPFGVCGSFAKTADRQHRKSPTEISAFP